MLIINGEPINNTDLKYFKDNNFEAYYTGFFFIPSFQNGEQTLLKIIEEINANNLDFIQDLYGTYFIAIKHTNQNKSYVFTDNSGLFKAFIHENIISTSFNELIEYSNSKYSINYESLVDFLHFGFVFFDNTLCKEISKLNPNFFYVINPDNSITKVNKNLSKIDGTPPIDPYVFFEHLHESIKKETFQLI